MTSKDVLREYNRCKSIRATAHKLSISTGVVRKCLVTYRVIDTPLIKTIAELRAMGMSQKDIADMLHTSTSNVNVNTPYERGTYLHPSTSINAARIRSCRKRKTHKVSD